MTIAQEAEAGEAGVALAIVPLAHVGPAGGMSQALAEAMAAWLDAKHGRSGSTQTLHAYRDTLLSYRAACQYLGLDLDASDVLDLDLDTVLRELASVAQAWAGRARATGQPVAPATYNQRLAIVSSFYAFAIRRKLLTLRENPVEQLDRRSVQTYAAAGPLAPGNVAARSAAVDSPTPAGPRGYALLAVPPSHGRR